MKSYAPFKFGGKDNLLERKRWADVLKSRGTSRAPGTPTALSVTAKVGSIEVSWAPPPDPKEVIKGWRIYQDDENHLVLTIRDPGQRAVVIVPRDLNVHNYFVSAVNADERESAKVHVQGKAL